MRKVKEKPLKLKRVRSKIKVNQEITKKFAEEVFMLSRDTKLGDIKVFAGKGDVRVAAFLSEDYGGAPKGWRHTEGSGYVDVSSEQVKAKIHWFEHKDFVFIKFKIKEWQR